MARAPVEPLRILQFGAHVEEALWILKHVVLSEGFIGQVFATAGCQ